VSIRLIGKLARRVLETPLPVQAVRTEGQQFAVLCVGDEQESEKDEKCSVVKTGKGVIIGTPAFGFVVIDEGLGNRRNR
jgi:hypothetical protein